MCGISGIWLSENATLNKVKILEEISSSLNHRGPDDNGLWFDEDCCLGLAHKRLSIVDLSKAGHQPMKSDSGRFVISLNGEIYNHLEIKEELIKNKLVSSKWLGTSDTETLLKAIEAWGLLKTLEKIIGMFAFALWDRSKKELFLVRDRSELSAFEIASKGNLEIDPISLKRFFSYCCITAPHSIYKDIYQLKPGHLIQINSFEDIFNNQLIKQKKWWSLYDIRKKIIDKNNSFRLSEKEIITDLDQRLNKTIQNQSKADVPLGVFLSSGIDSSLITAIYQYQKCNPISTFTIGFPDMGLGEKGFDESINAKLISNYLKTNHTQIPITSNEIISHIPEMANIFSEPFADSSQIPTFLLSKTVRESGLKVILSGDGGDELFGGYNRHYIAPNIYNLMQFLPRKAKEKIVDFILNSKLNNKKLILDKRNKLANAIRNSHSLEAIYYSLISTWSKSDELISQSQLSKNFFEELNQEVKEIFEDDNLNKLEKLMMADTIHYLPNDILVKVDRSSMAVGLETRAPFLDHHIAEYAWEIPEKFKINYSYKGIHTKYILKKLLNKYIPKNLVSRQKSGFAIPIGYWLRGPLKEWADTIINSKELKSNSILNHKKVKSTWDQHLRGEFDNTSKLWTILMWQSWANKRSINI